MKFGGTSVEDARAFERVRRVVAAREAERPVVVVSAMGGFTDALLEAGFATLIDAGIDPQLAYLECVSELKLLADLIEARGIAGVREAISNTAELGANLGGPRLIDEGTKQRMRDVLVELRSDQFAKALIAEAASDYPRLRAERRKAADSALETVRRSLL